MKNKARSTFFEFLPQ